jgi:hypothetical protein
VISDLHPGYLTWDEVDPARHPFDPSSAAQVVASLGPARRVPGPNAARHADDLWADAMSYALAEHYGRWVLGWRWSHDEGDFDGGPVGAWCCPRGSIGTPEETIARVAEALREWRAWLESLAGWFEAYPLDPASIDDQRILWERAARNLIWQVVDRTGGGSGWYGHCGQVLSWFLQRWQVPAGVAETLVAEAIGGRFRSWTGPDLVLVDDVAERLAQTLHWDTAPPRSEPDHLERWLEIRASVPWHDASDGGEGGPVTPSRDGAADDIRLFDGAIDLARADGLLAALELARADAARGADLTFERLQSWQQHVLGTPQPPPFRRSPAFAKGGRERYGIAPGTRARLDACLAESAYDRERPLFLTARAARAYLDVCFFHPFDDGNARAAFLALVFVLAREGVGLDRVGLLRRVSFQADDPEDPLTLTRSINVHLASTRREASR